MTDEHLLQFGVVLGEEAAKKVRRQGSGSSAVMLIGGPRVCTVRGQG